jgi:hypothetical protein
MKEGTEGELAAFPGPHDLWQRTFAGPRGAGDPRPRSITNRFRPKQQAFIDFVLSQYVKIGVQELDKEMLAPLLRLWYSALADAVADLGKPDEIGQVFTGFRRHLYEDGSAA